ARRRALHARQRRQPPADQVAPRLELAAHFLDALLVPLQGGQRGGLADAARAARLLALHVAHRLDYGSRPRRPAHAPAGHRVGLARAADGDGALGQFRPQRRETRRPGVTVDETFIYLVAEHGEV